MLKDVLQNIVAEKKRQGVADFVIRNFLKEYLQYPVLDFIYNNPEYKEFIFTGGSCLRICFQAPRLSEDLDFDLKARDYKKLKMEKLAKELQDFFKKKFLVDIKTKCQADKRIYLKFPLLKELSLAEESESDLLYVKIEPSQTVFTQPKLEIQPISQYGFNFLVQRYSLNFLMTGKLNAIFNREWFQGKDNEINIKGRDFYDLFWYLEQGVNPDYKNLKKLTGLKDATALKRELKKIIEKDLTTQKLAYDLKNFFPNQNFVSNFCKNYQKIMENFLK